MHDDGNARRKSRLRVRVERFAQRSAQVVDGIAPRVWLVLLCAATVLLALMLCSFLCVGFCWPSCASVTRAVCVVTDCRAVTDASTRTRHTLTVTYDMCPTRGGECEQGLAHSLVVEKPLHSMARAVCEKRYHKDSKHACGWREPAPGAEREVEFRWPRTCTSRWWSFAGVAAFFVLAIAWGVFGMLFIKKLAA